MDTLQQAGDSGIAPLLSGRADRIEPPPEFAICDTLRDLAGAILEGETPANVRVTVQYHHGRTGEVADVLRAIHGPPPSTGPVCGSWHHDGRMMADCLEVLVFCGVDEPAQAKRERLVRELAELDQAVADAER